MKNIYTYLLSACIVLSFNLEALAKSIAIVTNSESASLKNLSDKDLKKIFLGKLDRTPEVPKIRAAQLDPKNQEYKDFARNFLGKSARELRSYWSVQIFSGKAIPLKSFETSEQLKKWIENTPGGIGFIDSEELSSDLVVVRKVN